MFGCTKWLAILVIVALSVLADEPRFDGNPNWSPVDNRIVFSSDRSGNGDLYIVDLDSLEQRALITGDSRELHASWSPDGSSLIFDSDRGGNMDIWQSDATGANLQQLTRTPQAVELVPSWSPDGARILFNRMLDDGFDVFVMDADGGNEVNLTRSPGDDIARGWSPEGRRIVFNSDRSGNQDIYLMDLDDGSVKRLTRNPADERIALWGPGGETIYFARSHDAAAGGRQLIRLELGSGRESVFFDSPHEDFYPVWSPDGLRMVVVLRHQNGSDLYELSASGVIIRRLTGD